MLRNIVPNILAPIIVQVSFQYAWAILVESGMSFLGVGVPPPTPSWGRMVAIGKRYIGYPVGGFLIFPPSIAVILLIVSVNLMGDALRDHLDPKTRTGLKRV
jgi:peptide/nickel transport system permease protein